MAPIRTAVALAVQAGGCLASQAFVMQGGGSAALRPPASLASASSPLLSSVAPGPASSGAAPALCAGMVVGAVAAAALGGRSRQGSKAKTELAAFESELGVQPPTGFWDPLGFSKDGDVDTFKRRRASEIKHGRISMLATMGYMTPEITGKLPGSLTADLKYADIPNGLGAISKVPIFGWAQIFVYCALVEFNGMNDNGFDGTYGTPGDFGFKFISSKDSATKTRKLQAELANGRLAMMAIIGMFFQDGLTGSAWGDWAKYTDSPLR